MKTLSVKGTEMTTVDDAIGCCGHDCEPEPTNPNPHQHCGIEPGWYESIDNLIMLTSYLAEGGWKASDVAYAVEKPWKYEDEFKAARAEANKNA